MEAKRKVNFYLVKIKADLLTGRMEKVLREALTEDFGGNFTEDLGEDLSEYLDGELYRNECGEQFSFRIIENACAFEDAGIKGRLKNSRILFAVELDETGVNLEASGLLRILNSFAGKEYLSGAVGGVIVDGKGEMYTKDMGRRIVFAANMAGCTFPGKPLTEATASLNNFRVLADLWQVTREEAYVKSCRLLIDKITAYEHKKTDKPQILAIHASNKTTSNSLKLWEMVKEELRGESAIEEISIRNGQVVDCRGCRYEECLHFGENSGCFYGGVMVDKVYPAILKCEILMLICPNYNDAVSANIMAFINRLTAVFRANDFSKKKVYAIVVSGYSGGDIVAQQIISAVNMNKNFILPGEFALIETANAPGEIMESEGIRERAAVFGQRISSTG